MRLVCISDTHGDHEGLELPEGDVLIHAGDLTAHGRESETLAIMKWLGSRGFSEVLCIAGNHDTFMEKAPEQAQSMAREYGVTLLNDSGFAVQGFQFWGTPITPKFLDWSFMREPGEPIEAHWREIPDNTDVLITHGPPRGVMDGVIRDDGRTELTGCPSLLERVRSISPLMHIFGHIHEGRGTQTHGGVDFYNVCTMNEHYRRVYSPVIIELTSD